MPPPQERVAGSATAAPVSHSSGHAFDPFGGSGTSTSSGRASDPFAGSFGSRYIIEFIHSVHEFPFVFDNHIE